MKDGMSNTIAANRSTTPPSSSPSEATLSEGRAVVFVGPTLDPAQARRWFKATYLPPAACGDLYRATRRRPWAIGLIDGFFQQRLSVWHKEILWAMQQGIHVFGSSSMGALRAAELETFGMVGVGAIFESFRDGRLENDDEVTIAHRIPEAGTESLYQATSEALVNMRATLQEAEAQGILSSEERQTLIRLAQECFYPERTYDVLLGLARQQPDLVEAAQRLEPWLEQGRIDLKRLDAVAMLQTMAAMEASTPQRKNVRYAFQRTTYWLTLCSRLERPATSASLGSDETAPDALLDELRLYGIGPYRELRDQALKHLWALELADQRQLTVDDGVERRAARRRAFEASLNDPLVADKGLETWALRQGLSPDMLDRLLLDETRIQKMERFAHLSLGMQIRDRLRLKGHYAPLVERARLKERQLKSCGLDEPSLEDLGLDEATLWSWYFEGQLQRVVPDDLKAYAANLDFSGVEALRQAVLREYCWQRENPQAASDFATSLSPARSPHDRF